MFKKLTTMLALALSLLLIVPTLAAAQDTAVTLSFSGLEPLGDAAVYEGWLIVDGDPQSTGTFNIAADGSIDTISTNPVANAGTASTFVLTIEPADDPDPAPASTHVLAGDFSADTANLTLSHPAALGTDFSDAAGSFIVATPTTTSTDDDLSGVWFLDPTGSDGPAASLDLPALPEGWAYEGWIVVDGTPVSTGRFTSATGADDFSGFSGPEGAPPFPGEDLITNAPAGLEFPTDVTGATVVISVEPAPDDSAAPFALKPLVGEVPAGVEVGALNTLGAGPAALSGTAVIVGGPAALATTGVESWFLGVIALSLIAAGGLFVASSRRELRLN